MATMSPPCYIKRAKDLPALKNTFAPLTPKFQTSPKKLLFRKRLLKIGVKHLKKCFDESFLNRDNPKLSTILNFRLFTRKVFEFTRKLVRIPGDFQVKNKCRILTLDK